MKKCSKCKEEQPASEFRKDKYRPDGLTVQCKSCHREYEARTRTERLKRGKKWRDANKDKIKVKTDLWYQENKERKTATQNAWREANIERDRNNKSKYYKNNKAKMDARSPRRQTLKHNATPKWADKELIESYYIMARYLEKQTGSKIHVDHQIPLNNPLVCGLHTQENLELLFAKDNLSKGNKFDPNKYVHTI